MIAANAYKVLEMETTPLCSKADTDELSPSASPALPRRPRPPSSHSGIAELRRETCAICL